MPSPSDDVLRCTSEKLLAESAAVLDAAEAVGKIRPVLQGAELAFRIGVVVGDVRAAVGLGDSQVRQEESHRLGAHRGAAIGMEGELTGRDALLGATVLDEPLGQFGTFAHGHHPADDVAAEHIQDHVEVEVGPFGGAEQFGDVPTPELIGSGGQQFRLLIGRMGELIAAFASFSLAASSRYMVRMEQ